MFGMWLVWVREGLLARAREGNSPSFLHPFCLRPLHYIIHRDADSTYLYVYLPSVRIIRAKWEKRHVVQSVENDQMITNTVTLFTHKQMHRKYILKCFSLKMWRCTRIMQRFCTWINFDVIWLLCMCRVKSHWLYSVLQLLAAVWHLVGNVKNCPHAVSQVATPLVTTAWASPHDPATGPKKC